MADTNDNALPMDDRLSQLIANIQPPSDDQYGPLALNKAPAPAPAPAPEAQPPAQPAPPGPTAPSVSSTRTYVNPASQPIVGMPRSKDGTSIRPTVVTSEQQSPPPPSDDSAQYQQRMDTAQQQFADKIARIRQLQDQVRATPPPNPANYGAHLWERLLGFAAGTAAGYGGGPQVANQTASQVVNRRYNKAVGQYQPQHQALLDQLQSEREDVPIYRDMADLAYRQYNERRLEKKDSALADYHDQLADIRGEIAKNNLQVAQDKLDQAQKQLEAHQEEADRLGDYRDQIADLRSRLVDLKEKNANGEKPATKAQFQVVQNKRDSAWEKAKREYRKAISDPRNGYGKGLAHARENYYDDRQDAQNEYEQGIAQLGGTAEHVELPRNHFGEDTAAEKTQPISAKKASQADVKAYATKAGLSYEKALEKFKQANYSVQ